MPNYQVTYIGITDIPEIGPKKRLGFYTETEESKKDKILFFRLSPATFKKYQIEKFVQEGKTIELETPIPISPGEMLWLDNKGNVYLGTNSETNQKLKFQFTYKSILKARV